MKKGKKVKNCKCDVKVVAGALLKVRVIVLVTNSA